MPNNRKDSEYNVNSGAKTNFNKKPAASKAKTGAGAKPKAKPAKAKIGAGAKPKAKPESVKAKGYKRKADLGGGPRKSAKKTNEKQSKANSGNAVLGQDRKSPAASKMNRQPGYSSGTGKKESPKMVTRSNIGRKSSKPAAAPKSDKKKNPRTMRGGRS